MVIAGFTAAQAAPRIVFATEEVTFENVKEGEVKIAEFKFTNKGDQNLIIDRVAPSCGCTVATFDEVVKPGKTGVIKLTLDTVGITGAFRKTAAVSSNDPARPTVSLVMLGETIAKLKVDQGRRIHLKGCLGREITTTATLSDPDGQRILLTGIDNPMEDYLEAKLEPLPGGTSFKLHLKSKADRAMEFVGPLFIQMAGGVKVTVYVYAEIMGAYTVQPHEVNFGSISHNMGSGLERSILIQKACCDELKLEGLIYNLKHFDIEQRWEKPGEKLYLVIKPNLDNLPAGPFRETLAIHASGEGFTVPLNGINR
jgi:hypothetical protein